MFRAFAILIAVSLSACGLFHKKNPTGPIQNSDAQKEIYYQAEVQYQLENYKEAKELFEKFVKQSPKPSSGYYRLACMERINKDFDLALQLSKKAQREDTGNTYYLLLFDADVYAQTRSYQKAADIYADLAVKKKNRWSLFNDAGKMYQAAGNMEKLIQLCNQWEKAFGLREEIASTRANAFFRSGMPDSASNEYLKLIKKYPERRQYKLTYAEYLQKAGHPEKTIEIYNELLAVDPENPELLTHLCQYYKTADKTAEHWNLAKKVVASRQMELHPKENCISVFLTRTSPYFDSLEPLLTELIKLHPEQSLAWKMLADWDFERHKYLPAANAYSHGLGILAYDYQGWIKYCTALQRLMQYTRMVKVTDSMLDLFPSNPEVYNWSAIALLENKNFEKAKEQGDLGLSFAVEESTKRALQITLARVLGYSGKLDKALEMLNSLKRNDSTDRYITKEILQLYLFHNKKEETQMPLPNFLPANSNPEFNEFIKTLGLIDLAKGSNKGAAAYFQEALGYDEGRVDILELLGDANWQMKDESAAKIYWLQAQALGSGSATLPGKLASVMHN